MPAPAKEFFVFGGTIATLNTSAHFATAASAFAFADWHRQRIDHEQLATGKQLSESVRDERQPLG
jgi:hypothetical protein